MKKNQKTIRILLILVLIVLLFVIISKSFKEKECEKDEDCSPQTPIVGAKYYCENGVCKTKPFGNPASEYCLEHNGSIAMRTDDKGNQYGVCIFNDMTECEEWTYYRGECKPGKNPPPTITEHNGLSTYENCSTVNDCVVSGCNGEICQSRFEKPRVSICVYNPPYPKELGYVCKCVNQKCAWTI
jgi:eight-cysteine-cluster-containing protein